MREARNPKKSQGGMRPRGLTLLPGSVLEARHAAGMSLGQLAGGEISRTALHLIETGKTRPTLPTLQLIASRTGRQLSDFLAPGQEDLVRTHTSDADLAIAYAELEDALAVEDFERVRSLAEQKLAAARVPHARARLSQYSGQALVRLAEPDKALARLNDALSYYEAEGDDRAVVECLDWKAAAFHLKSSPAALAIAAEALDRCRALRPVPARTESRILGRIGSIHVASRHWEDAISSYEAALAAAGPIRDFSRMAKMYNDLTIAYAELGDLERAQRSAERSVTLHEALEDRRSIARAETNLGLVLMRRDQLLLAETHLLRSLDLAEAEQLEHGRANVLIALGQLALRNQALPEAEGYAARALELAAKLEEQPALAEAHQLLGRVAEQHGDHDRADREFWTATSLLQRLGLEEALKTCRFEYATMLEARGDHQAALLQLRQVVSLLDPRLQAPADPALDVTPEDRSSRLPA